MAAFVQRFLAQSVDVRSDKADLIVFLSTTGLCALGGLMLPLVG